MVLAHGLSGRGSRVSVVEPLSYSCMQVKFARVARENKSIYDQNRLITKVLDVILGQLGPLLT